MSQVSNLRTLLSALTPSPLQADDTADQRSALQKQQIAPAGKAVTGHRTPKARWCELLRTTVLVCGLVMVFVRMAHAAEPFFFIQLSDPQFGMFTENSNFTQETVNFEFAVATVNRLKPAFVVVTGDLVHKPGDTNQIAEYRRIVAKIDRSIPVYDVAGNHDVENVPTPETIAAYTNRFGPDHYTFRRGDFVGMILNSSLIHSPQKAMAQFEAQERWLEVELEKARAEKARHIVVFQHHPWCLASADEKDEYFNIPLERRVRYFALFHKFGVNYAFCGHYHRNAFARDGKLEIVTTGPVGKPLGKEGSGIRVAIVRDDRIDHRYYQLGEIPTHIDLAVPATKPVK